MVSEAGGRWRIADLDHGCGGDGEGERASGKAFMTWINSDYFSWPAGMG